MGLRRFYRLNGTSVLVPPKVYAERVARQDARARRRGEAIVRNARGVPRSLDPEEARRVEQKAAEARERARRYWQSPKGQVARERARTRAKKQAARRSADPVLLRTIRSTVGRSADIGNVIARTAEVLPTSGAYIVLRVDGRAVVRGWARPNERDWIANVRDELLAALAGAEFVGIEDDEPLDPWAAPAAADEPDPWDVDEGPEPWDVDEGPLGAGGEDEARGDTPAAGAGSGDAAARYQMEIDALVREGHVIDGEPLAPRLPYIVEAEVEIWDRRL